MAINTQNLIAVGRADFTGSEDGPNYYTSVNGGTSWSKHVFPNTPDDVRWGRVSFVNGKNVLAGYRVNSWPNELTVGVIHEDGVMTSKVTTSYASDISNAIHDDISIIMTSEAPSQIGVRAYRLHSDMTWQQIGQASGSDGLASEPHMAFFGGRSLCVYSTTHGYVRVRYLSGASSWLLTGSWTPVPPPPNWRVRDVSIEDVNEVDGSLYVLSRVDYTHTSEFKYNEFIEIHRSLDGYEWDRIARTQVLGRMADAGVVRQLDRVAFDIVNNRYILSSSNDAGGTFWSPNPAWGSWVRMLPDADLHSGFRSTVKVTEEDVDYLFMCGRPTIFGEYTKAGRTDGYELSVIDTSPYMLNEVAYSVIQPDSGWQVGRIGM